jgi:hypothetical protein
MKECGGDSECSTEQWCSHAVIHFHRKCGVDIRACWKNEEIDLDRPTFKFEDFGGL